MRDPFIQVPFASGGDTSTIPTNTQPTGSISMQQGWGADYQKEIGVDPGAKTVDRQDMNELFNIVTSLINRWQTETFPEWIDPAANAGAPYVYPLGVVVRYSESGEAPFVAWVNALADNATSPSVENGWMPFDSIAQLASDPTESTRGAPFLASSAEAKAGTDNTKMLSALRGTELLKAAAKFANVPGAGWHFTIPTELGDVKVQMGTTASLPSGISTVTLPIAYTTTHFVALISAAGVYAGGNQQSHDSSYDKTLANFKIHNASNLASAFSYISVGI